MTTVDNASSVASPPDPAQDHPATIAPTNIELILHAARTLLTYGRHLIDTVRQRAAAPNFNTIAAAFGTANLATILAHLNRGILRAMALERVLLARAAAGKDFDYVRQPAPTVEEYFAALDAKAAQPAPTPPAPRKQASRPSRPAGWDDPELFMPTLEELERQIRCRPIGRTIADICLDLGALPAFFQFDYWTFMFDIINMFDGLHSVGRLQSEKIRRREAFSRELDSQRDANWDWVKMAPKAMREVLGFAIGEPPVNPFDPAAAIATGPP